MEIKTITPFEYTRDGYRDKVRNGLALVMCRCEYGDLYTVKRIRKNKYDVTIIMQDWTWQTQRSERKSEFDLCLQVIEPIDYDALRQRLAEIMLALPDDEVLNELLTNGWELDSA